ncbi:sporulation protein YabP [Caldalkalibacillus mannanilyticus]|uniref:sporulation protein YabP n=1 Tax=Caldalkalibacillus mannanilyticus TaxID=1418 RepID=UPI000469096B|nr:sporulation protein YabP [Caldalkalibacillus mannanilyticus]
MLDQQRYHRHDSQKSHEIKIINRKKMDITGVVNVESFDNEEFLLETELGFLAIRGQNLHMKNLNVENGLVSIEGLVIEMVYVDHSSGGDKAKGLFSKLFK